MKYLHTMIRVGNLEKSIQFYCEILNFKLESRQDYPTGKFTLAFLRSANDEQNGPMLELTYNWGVSQYDIGKGYGHVAYKVSSLEEIQKKLLEAGLNFSWGPGKTPNGQTNMAFVMDPDGYKIELLEYLQT
jgi:lactoylglutathione lyase